MSAVPWCDNMMHAAPAALPKDPAGIVRLLSAPNTSGPRVVERRDQEGRHALPPRLRLADVGAGQHPRPLRQERGVGGDARDEGAVRVLAHPSRSARLQAEPDGEPGHTGLPRVLVVLLRPDLPRQAVREGAEPSSVSRTRRSGFPVACVRRACSSTCVTAFGAPTLLVTPQLSLIARASPPRRARPTSRPRRCPRRTTRRSASSPSLRQVLTIGRLDGAPSRRGRGDPGRRSRCRSGTRSR